MNLEKLTKSQIRKILNEANWECEGLYTVTAHWNNDEALLTLFYNSDKMVVTSNGYGDDKPIFKVYDVGGLDEFEMLFGLFGVGMC